MHDRGVFVGLDRMSRALLAVCLGIVSRSLRAEASFSTAAGASPPYLNADLPVEARVDDLVSRMTVDEKAAQVVNNAAPIFRLGVPGYGWWGEALHGVMIGQGTTVFPEPIGMAASYDAPLLREVAIAIGTEARAMYHEAARQGQEYLVGLDFWAPNLNIFRDPRWGRGQETYGEDPFLTGRMGVAFVEGMQGDDPKYYRVIATPKHFAVHSGPEPLRHGFDARVSPHDLEDTYLPAFRAALVEGKAGSVMCVYNSVNGEPGCVNQLLLGTRLRGEWSFGGYVVSDCDAVGDILEGHHYVNTLPEAAALSMRRGTDLDCNHTSHDSAHPADWQPYVVAVTQGLLKERELDASVKRLMRARFALGLFDPPERVPYASIPFSAIDTDEHRQLARRMARESIVLLKNNGVLPVRGDVKKIAVIGPLAKETDVLLGNYHGTPSRIESILDAIRAQFPAAKVAFASGSSFPATVGDTIPEEELSTEQGQSGLGGEYFGGTELQGRPIMKRVDSKIDFDAVRPDQFSESEVRGSSVRWRGYLTPKASGMYRVGATASDGIRLVLDGRILADSWRAHTARTISAPVELEAGHRYALSLEHFQSAGEMNAKLIWIKPEEEMRRDARTAALGADLVIAIVGITSQLEGEEMNVDLPGFKGGDRTSIDLPGTEDELLKAVKTTGRPLVVVLLSGSALAVNWADREADAILEAWYPGEEGGVAVAETLTGDNNPSGRLPVTFYSGLQQLPDFQDYSMASRTYRYFTGKPLYPFGHGLSYTRFKYGALKISSRHLDPKESLEVEADVRNVGLREGDEVVQLYLSFPSGAGAPIRALRGFTRVHLASGTSSRVRFLLSPRDLSMVSAVGKHIVAAGRYAISVGGGQPGTGAAVVATTFSIKSSQSLPH